MQFRWTLATTVLLLLCYLPVCGQDTSGRWKEVVSKIQTAHDYRLTYSYTGPKGKFRFAYSVVSPGKVRTEILEPSDRGVGTVIVYDPSDPEVVHMDIGFAQVRRSIDSRDIKGTSLYIPLYQQLLDKVKTCTRVKVIPEDDLTCFAFSGNGPETHRILVNRQREIVAYEGYLDGKLVERLDFADICWNTNP